MFHYITSSIWWRCCFNYEIWFIARLQFCLLFYIQVMVWRLYCILLVEHPWIWGLLHHSITNFQLVHILWVKESVTYSWKDEVLFTIDRTLMWESVANTDRFWVMLGVMRLSWFGPSCWWNGLIPDVLEQMLRILWWIFSYIEKSIIPNKYHFDCKCPTSFKIK